MSSLGVAIVTGAAQGIGRAISLRLADDGFDVVVNDILLNKENLDAVISEIAAKGRKACQIIADVTDEGQVKGMIDDVVRQLGGLDVMVANAGICRVGTLLDTTVENWEANFAVSVKGTFLCFKYAAQQMIAQGRGGRLVGASSVAGKTGHANQIAYCSAKFAVRGLTQCAGTLPLELGRYGITVNSYAPGAMVTPMCKYIRVANDQRTSDTQNFYHGDYYEKMADRCAVGYLGKAEDVASIVSYLVSKEAHYITGEQTRNYCKCTALIL
ncbi:NAD(P)-binding protein [Gyrodon lividus]|nr:NAD(P)-binding protein [Gyrodon lividus]